MPRLSKYKDEREPEELIRSARLHADEGRFMVALDLLDSIVQFFLDNPDYPRQPGIKEEFMKIRDKVNADVKRAMKEVEKEIKNIPIILK